ncbi:MAG TPA: hypothetical protein DIW81_09055 [Planctomycetaceae bacterium]|nr:hypothetical protein [Rubinisphaera sp.]HCS51725.1 hypothetical protein [Planctomycetaceae bacterium]
MAKYHPNKEISAAIEFALENGWRFEMSQGHPFGQLYCPFHDRSGCIIRVHSTPRVNEHEAQRILREINKCPHQQMGEPDERF